MALKHYPEVYCIYASPTRPGSGFIQSLFDGHPEIATIPDLSDDWDYVVGEKPTKTEEVCLRFLARNPGVFDSRLNQIERFHELGEKLDQFSQVSFRDFSEIVQDFLGEETYSNKDFFYACHLAYHRVVNCKSSRPKVIVYNSHTLERTIRVQELVEKPVCLYTVRNPVNGIARAIQGFRDARRVWHPMGDTPWFNPDNFYNLAFYSRNLAILAQDLETLRANIDDVRVVGFEALHENPKNAVLSKFCLETGVKFSEILLRSTFWGLAWHGDHKSSSSRSGFNRKPRKDVSGGFYFKYDRVVIEWLYQDLIQENGLWLNRSMIPRKGSSAHKILQITIPFLVMLPTRHELRSFAWHLRLGNWVFLAQSFLWFAYRAFIQMRSFYRTR